MASEHTFLVELGVEELPPDALAPLAEAFAHGIEQGLKSADIALGAIHAYATPRRLAVQIERLADHQPDRDIERLGPAVKAAFDSEGNPTKAAVGFAGSIGIEPGALERIATDKGERIGYRYTQPGEATITLLPEIVTRAVDALPVPKRMRWGASRIEFSRPVHWLVMLYGEQIVPATVLGLEADRITFGHRFHHPAAITLHHADDYLASLEEARVLADMPRRRDEILRQVQAEAARIEATAVIDDDLLTEVAGLVEWPVALTGRFDERFLEVPAECLISSMKANQKYFHLLNDSGKLLPSFITIANIESQDPQQVIEGNERVIRPRLADAAFFFETDRKRSLDTRRAELENVVFQQQLGSLADKSRRVETLARHIATQIAGDEAHAGRAAQLAKCDLVSEMVLEFPELQGIMGAYYARFDGEPEQVAKAIYQQYLPRFAGDEIPDEPAGLALALADRLDTLTGIFGIGQRPTGAKDPFALRRASIGVLNILIKAELNLDLRELLSLAVAQHDTLPRAEGLVDEVLDYMLDRFRAWAQDEGISVEVYMAVRARPVTRPFDFERRLRAVQAFSQRSEAQALAAANKRVANILAKQEEAAPNEVAPTLLQDEAEKTLHAQVEARRGSTAPLIAAGRYQEALDELASLKESVDAFFDQVMVMADDEAVRLNRLALLAGLQGLFLEVADISLLQQ